MNISVIIPTIDRPTSVIRLIESLLQNTILPREIFVVEQGDQKQTQQMIEEQIIFPPSVILRVLFLAEKSASQARQKGADRAKEDILCFLDDDMTIANDYLEKSLRYLSSHSSCLGLTGAYQHTSLLSIKKLFAIFFGLYSFRGTNRVLPSGNGDFIRGKNLKQEQPVEYLYGCNMVVRKKVFQEGIHFNSHFLRWSFGEDVDFSYRVQKAHPGSLMFLPDLHVVHHADGGKQISSVQMTRMKIVYRFLFWSQSVTDGSWKDLCWYVWSQVGLSLFELVQFPEWNTVKALFSSYVFLIKNARALKEENVDYNTFILNA